MSTDANACAVVAWCETCELPFPAGKLGAGDFALGVRGQDVSVSKMRVDRAGVVSIQGSTASCPTCGNMGTIPDGLYDTISGVVRQSAKVFRSFSPEEAARFITALRKCERNEIDDDAVVAAAPPAARKWMKDTLKLVVRRDILIPILISVLIAVCGAYLSDVATQQIESAIQHSNASTHQQVKKLDHRVEHLNGLVKIMLKEVEQENGQSISPKISSSRAQPPMTSGSPPDTTPNRNAACWCGSGRKFKRCHRGHNKPG